MIVPLLDEVVTFAAIVVAVPDGVMENSPVPAETAVTLSFAELMNWMKAAATVSMLSVEPNVLLMAVPFTVSVAVSPAAQVPASVTVTEVEKAVVMVPDVEKAVVVTGSLQLGVRG